MSVKTITSYVVVCDVCGFAGCIGATEAEAIQNALYENWTSPKPGFHLCDMEPDTTDSREGDQ